MILHFCVVEKFIPPFIELVNNEFDNQEHHFLVYGDRTQFPFKDASNVEYQPQFAHLRGNFWNNIAQITRFLELAKKSEKIILHGLWDDNLVRLLFFYPSLLKKCYWIIWGGDLYRHIFREKGIRSSIHEFFRRIVIRKIGHFVSLINGDFELAQKWYGARGVFHECFVYLSNIFCGSVGSAKKSETINILVGNSADPSNRHEEIFLKLSTLKNSNFTILCPLSYGNQDYADKMVLKGKQIFGQKFEPLREMMTLEKYHDFLGTIDIAIFCHRRQQAMGNIINLLGMGKKVITREDITTWDFFKQIGISIYSFADFDLEVIDEESKLKNMYVIRKWFSKENLLKQLNSIFKGA